MLPISSPRHRTKPVLITRGQLTKITNRPQDERVTAFRPLVALLGVADKRRRVHPYLAPASSESARWIPAETQGVSRRLRR
ncbi:DUF5958 family protein [Streptomyces sp. NPDC005373]|uniref:DUF5958 family protein n=1 Tax=Streptomyces sp. NPDC005373 TaxID=3156879 RepID=UPI0033B8F7A6